MESPPTMTAVKLALLARQSRAQGVERANARAEPLAIIGMACRFPGGATSPDAYWAVLRDGVDAICEVPRDRWDWKAYYDPDPSTPGKMTTRWGGFLREPVDGLDAAFFAISPREAVHLDPQQRLFLEVAHEALDDAGVPRERLAGSRTGVFLASYHNDYGQAQYADLAAIDAYTTTGTSHSILVNRLSYLLDLRGPSISVDTACSSSLVAVHLACESLRSADCDFALAGGVSLILTPEMTVALSKWGFLAEDGRCKTFDARANGFVRGEGCGLIAIKRLADALAEGDEVLAVIRGSAVNQDGRTNVLTAPSGLAQQAVVRAALEHAGLPPAQVSYVEAHGTGTALGDPIEVEALAEVLGPRPADARCLLGSAKTNIGHLEAAAGIAGLMKVVLALRHDAIPPHLHFTRANPHIDFSRSPFDVPTTLRPWPRTATPRVAGVSSFGFGGTNAHVVLEEAPRLPAPVAPTAPAGRAELLPISAHTPAALRTLAAAYRDLLLAPSASAAALCRGAALQRDALEHRVAVAGTSSEALASQLDAFLSDAELTAGAAGRRRAGARPRVAFVFSGQGPQWWAMGRELATLEPVFAEALASCDAALLPHTGWSVLGELAHDEEASRLGETEVAQPGLFAIQVALAALWRSWGVVPDAVVGHSVGEIAAAHIAGALTLDDAARLVALRGKLMQEATGLGRMAQVQLTEAEAAAIAAASSGTLSLAAINGPGSCVLSGDTDALHAALATLGARGVEHRLLPVNYAFHSAQMAPFQARLAEALAPLAPRAPTTRMISTVTARDVGGMPLDGAYWGRNLREPVRLAPAIAVLAADGVEAYVEVGPHPVLRLGIEGVLDTEGIAGTVVASLRRGQPEGTTTRAAAAALWALGASLRWPTMATAVAHRVALPAYPWQRTRYWQSPAPARAASSVARSADQHPLLGARVTSPVLAGALHTAHLSSDAPAFLGDHRVGGTSVFPATAYLELALAALRLPNGATATLSDVELRDALALRDGTTFAVQLATMPTAGGGVAFEVHAAPLDDAGEAGVWTTHARGRAVQGLDAQDEVEPLDDVRARCGVAAGVSAFYAAMDARGIAFGPAFRGVRRLFRGAGEALGEIALPADAGATAAMRMHPALLDACLQVSLAVLHPDDRADASESGVVYLPLGLDEFVLAGRLSGTLWSHATARLAGDGSTWRVDLVVRAEEGTLVAKVNGLRLAPVRRSRLAALSGHDPLLHQLTWVAAQSTPPQPLTSGTWLVLADATGVGAAAAASLRARGATVALARAATDSTSDDTASRVDVHDPEAVTSLLRRAAAAPLAGIVDCWTLNARDDGSATTAAAEAEEVMSASLHVLQALAALPDAPPLWLATRGACAVDGEPRAIAASQAAAVGLARTLELEHPELRVIRVDLDAAPASSSEVAAMLVDELLRGVSEEREVARRAGARMVPRLMRVARVAAVATDASLRLEAAPSGLLEDLAARPHARRAPSAGEVEIDVEASGLNFRDVLNGLGVYPGEAGPLGSECAGVVSRVGAGVTDLIEGDRVMAFAPGSLSAHVTVPAAWVSPMPDGLTSAQAATLPVAFLTARFGLVDLARLGAGERVLIHAGTGGVGMAAIQVAQALGAEVFATAGSPAKRALLARMGVTHVMDSRSLTFADAVREATGGTGVHVVLNALAGEFIPASLGVLAARGRFLEMGKREIWSAAQVARVRPDVSYLPFDLGDAARTDATLVPRLFSELRAGLADRSLRPLPVSTHALADAAVAFRTIAQAKHVGKLAITFASAGAGVPRPDASYLITGGLGALGLVAAQWLVARGARHVVLASRRAPDAAAQTAIDAWRREGVAVTVATADVTRALDVDALLARIDAGPAPLGGVLHAAGIVDDGAFIQQTRERAAAVFAPKARGLAMLLDRLGGRRLDFVVCYSSAASVIGSPGQATYAAANAVADALCAAARRAGAPATSVQWGAWAEGGMAAALGERESARAAARGLVPMRTGEALAGLERALATGLSNVTVMSVDWARHAAALAPGLPRAMFAAVHGARPTVVGTATSADVAKEGLRARLDAAVPAQRRGLLVAHVRRLALHCLGIEEGTPVDDSRPLKDLGLDSLLSVELRNALARSLAITLPATLAFDYPSTGAMAGSLMQRLFPDASSNGTSKAPARDARDDAQALAAVATLTDDEAEALLVKELDARR